MPLIPQKWFDGWEICFIRLIMYPGDAKYMLLLSPYQNIHFCYGSISRSLNRNMIKHVHWITTERNITTNLILWFAQSPTCMKYDEHAKYSRSI